MSDAEAEEEEVLSLGSSDEPDAGQEQGIEDESAEEVRRKQSLGSYLLSLHALHLGPAQHRPAGRCLPAQHLHHLNRMPASKTVCCCHMTAGTA